MPSSRGELEITDVNQHYLKRQQVRLEKLGRGFAWLDTGTQQNLLQASQFVETVETRQGYKIACLEEIAFHEHWITTDQLTESVKISSNSPYGEYLKSLLEENF